MESISHFYKKLRPESKEALLGTWQSSSDRERAKLFVDTRTAAGIAGVSQRTIRLWIATGSISAVPIGKKLRIPITSLEEFIRTRALQDD